MGVLEGGMKGQPAVEFLSIYSWTLIGVILFVVVISVLATAQTKSVYPPPHCYITSSLPCYGTYIMTNSIGTIAVLIFNNDLGTQIGFPNNAFAISPSYTGTTYYGQCAPANAITGAVVVCNATLAGFSTYLGTQLGPNFVLSYRICGAACSNTLPVYNTSGTAVLAVSPYTPNIP